MWKKDKIQEELNEIAPGLDPVNYSNPYLVPHLYFENFPATILGKVTESGEELSFGKIEKASPFAAPAGYFDNFSSQLMSKIKTSTAIENEIEEELATIAPLLATMSRQQVYTVPAGYFDKLQIKTEQHAPARVVSMYPAKKVFQYMAAAVVIFFMAIAAYIFFDKTPTATNNTATVNVSNALDQLSEEEIIDYLQANSTTLDAGLNIIIQNELDRDIDEVINDLSDEDLQQFLKQYAEPTNGGNTGT